MFQSLIMPHNFAMVFPCTICTQPASSPQPPNVRESTSFTAVSSLVNWHINLYSQGMPRLDAFYSFHVGHDVKCSVLRPGSRKKRLRWALEAQIFCTGNAICGT